MAAIRTVRMDDFTGGLNLRADPFQLESNESPDLLNVDVDPLGGFAMRGGWQRLNTSAIGAATWSVSPQSLWTWERGGSPQLLLSANNLVYFATTTSFTSTAIATSAADGASFAPWAGTAQVVYVSVGNGAAGQKWNGTTATPLTASASGAWQDSLTSPTGTHMPKANLNATHVDRLWVANTVEDGVTYPDRVRFSHPNFPESWRQADYIDVVGGGSGITALVPFGGALLVFKRASVWAIYGYSTDTFQLTELTSQVGVSSKKHVVATEQQLFFFSFPNGVLMFDGENFKDASVKLRPLITQSTLNEAQLAKVSLSWINRRLWWSIPSGSATSNSECYVFDPTISAWTRYRGSDGAGLSVGCDYVTSSGTKNFLACHPTNAYVIKVDDPNAVQDNLTGTPANFTSYYTTGWQDAGNVSSKKMWRRPDMVVGKPSVDTALLLEAFHNWEEGAVRRSTTVVVPAGSTGLVWAATAVEPDAVPGWGEAVWGATATGATFQRGGNLGLARSVQLKITGPGGKAWQVNSLTWKFNPRKVRA